jgi:hypothetical protein
VSGVLRAEYRVVDVGINHRFISRILQANQIAVWWFFTGNGGVSQTLMIDRV